MRSLSGNKSGMRSGGKGAGQDGRSAGDQGTRIEAETVIVDEENGRTVEKHTTISLRSP